MRAPSSPTIGWVCLPVERRGRKSRWGWAGEKTEQKGETKKGEPKATLNGDGDTARDKPSPVQGDGIYFGVKRH